MPVRQVGTPIEYLSIDSFLSDHGVHPPLAVIPQELRQHVLLSVSACPFWILSIDYGDPSKV